MANFDELYESVCDYNDSMTDELFTEGANMEIRKKFSYLRKEYKKLTKQIKRYKRKKNTKEIEKAIDDYLILMKKTRREIDNIPDTVGSIIIGYIINDILSGFEVFLATIVTLPLGGIGGVIDGIKILIQEISGIMHQYKQGNGNAFSIEMLNLRRAKLNAIMDSMETYIKKVKQGLKDFDDNDVNESVNDIKLNIYESCNDGYITEDEMNMLLDIMK